MIAAMRSGMTWVDEPMPWTDTAAAAGGAYSVASTGPYQRLPTPKKNIRMMMYMMKHYPGNTNNSWKRQLFTDLAQVRELIRLNRCSRTYRVDDKIVDIGTVCSEGGVPRVGGHTDQSLPVSDLLGGLHL